MGWIKNVVLDLVVTAIVAWWVFSAAEWAYWVILVYTPLMVVLKLVGLSSGVSMAAAQTKDAAPLWFFHVVYAVNLILLLVGKWWLMVAGWAIIWVLSAIGEARKPAVRKPGDGKKGK